MELTDSEKENLKKILRSIFGTNTVSHWKMNGKVLEVTGQMLAETAKCSDAMDYVPRPAYLVQPSYLKQYLKEMVRRTTGERKLYSACQNMAKLKWQTRITIAAQGL